MITDREQIMIRAFTEVLKGRKVPVPQVNLDLGTLAAALGDVGRVLEALADGQAEQGKLLAEACAALADSQAGQSKVLAELCAALGKPAAPPVVNVTPPAVHVAAPQIHLAPEFTVEQPQRRGRKIRVKDNGDGSTTVTEE